MKYVFYVAVWVSVAVGADSNYVLQSRLHSLRPNSISQHLAFHYLYSHTEEGAIALSKALALLDINTASPPLAPVAFDCADLMAFLSVGEKNPLPVSEAWLCLIEAAAISLPNRQLRGFCIEKRADLIQLPAEEIDLTEALLFEHFGNSENEKRPIRAMIDFIALQIKAQLSQNPTPKEIITAINTFIFYELQFKFPPHSLWAQDVDLYTQLPSVLDGREGVCLGISTLYLGVAQRLSLPLEIVTPPGHIYLRWQEGNEEINIETTNRGIDVPTSTYYGVNASALQMRDIKETVGLNFMNQAAPFLSNKEWAKALTLYEKALDYIKEDPLLHLLVGICHLFLENTSLAKTYLHKSTCDASPYHFYPSTLASDFLEGRVDKNGLLIIFTKVDESFSSVMEKQKQLLSLVRDFPRFREGIFLLATTYLQMGRTKEALHWLERYHQIDPYYPTVEYYLAFLYIHRLHFEKAYTHLNQAYALTQEKRIHPALKELKQTLRPLRPRPH